MNLRRTVKNIVNVFQNRPAILFGDILVTTCCTQKCLQCNIPDTPGKSPFISVDDYQRIIDKFDQYGTQIMTLSGGEVMLHPRIDELIAYACTKRFIRTHILTTLYPYGAIVNKAVDLIIKNNLSVSISFDGFGEIADRLRGGKKVSATVMHGIEKLNQACIRSRKKIPRIATVTVNQLNLEQIPDIIRYFESMNWSISLDVYRWSSTTNREVDMLKIIDLKKLRQVIEIAKSSTAVRTPTWLLNGYLDFLRGYSAKLCPYIHSPTIGTKLFVYPDGDVRVCIGGSIGNLATQTFEEIFMSRKWRQRREELVACEGCWNTCYTPLAKLRNYLHLEEIRNILNL